MLVAEGDLDRLVAELDEVERWANPAPAERAIAEHFPRSAAAATALAGEVQRAAEAARAELQRVDDAEREAAAQSAAVQAQVGAPSSRGLL